MKKAALGACASLAGDLTSQEVLGASESVPLASIEKLNKRSDVMSNPSHVVLGRLTLRSEWNEFARPLGHDLVSSVHR